MVNPEQVRADWLASQASPRTRETYGPAIRAWFTFCRERGVDVWAAQRRDVDAWRAALSGRGLKASTVALRLATLASFYAYADMECDPSPIVSNPVARVKRPRVDKASKATGLTAEEARTMLAAADRDPRLAALAWLLLGTAARVSEIVGARVTDVGWDDGHRALMVTRKGGIVHPIKLQPRVWDAVSTYLDARVPVPDGWLIATTAGRRMTRQWAYQLVRKLATDALGRDLKIGPHDLRHTAITLALDAGMSLAEARQFAGHARASTTERYDRRANTRGAHASATVAELLGGSRDVA